MPATLAHLTDKDAATGEYKIPHIIYSDAYYSEMVPYADLILPDTTYLERWDCISLLDRPISEPDGPADAIRQPVVEPDRDVRPFQDVLIELGARLGLPGMVKDGRDAEIPRRLSRLHRQPRAAARHRPAGRLSRRGRRRLRPRRANPRQLEHYIDNGCFHIHHLPEHMRYYRHVNRDYLEWALDKGMRLTPTPVIFQLYSEPLQKFRLAARGHGQCCRPTGTAQRIETYFDPLPFWYPPFEGAALDEANFRCTPSPSGRWRCTIPGARRMPGCGRSTAPTGST